VGSRGPCPAQTRHTDDRRPLRCRRSDVAAARGRRRAAPDVPSPEQTAHAGKHHADQRHSPVPTLSASIVCTCLGSVKGQEGSRSRGRGSVKARGDPRTNNKAAGKSAPHQPHPDKATPRRGSGDERERTQRASDRSGPHQRVHARVHASRAQSNSPAEQQGCTDIQRQGGAG
jgi:hypothetical protein